MTMLIECKSSDSSLSDFTFSTSVCDRQSEHRPCISCRDKAPQNGRVNQECALYVLSENLTASNKSFQSYLQRFGFHFSPSNHTQRVDFRQTT